jgi:hypothetical protein
MSSLWWPGRGCYAVFTCGALHAVLDHMYSRLDSITSGAFGQLMFDEPLDTVLLGLLGNNYWGDNAPAVDSCVRSFLVEAWAARELAVAARRPATVLEVEVDLEPEHVPGPVCVRVPVPIGSAAGAVLGAGERICAECHSRRQPAVPGVPTLVSQVVWWCCQLNASR